MARGDASETAEGCGSAYYRYGAALFYRAQEEQDVFGDDMKTAAQQRDVQVGLRPLAAVSPSIWRAEASHCCLAAQQAPSARTQPTAHVSSCLSLTDEQ